MHIQAECRGAPHNSTLDSTMWTIRIGAALLMTLGALVPVIAEHAHLPSLWIPALFALVIGVIDGWFAPGKHFEALLAGVVGAMIGVSADAALDVYYLAQPRNLILIEWLIWASVVGVPIGFGAWVFGALQRHLARKGASSAV